MQILDDYLRTIQYDINEEFKHNGMIIKCIDGKLLPYKWCNCNYCYFHNKDCSRIACSTMKTTDGMTRLFIDPKNPRKTYDAYAPDESDIF